MATNMKPVDVANYRRNHKDIKEVTSSKLFISSGGGNIPHPEGLLSPIIFGETPQEKKERVGYINLAGQYIRPYAYKLIKRSFRDLDAVITGEKQFTIDKNGELVVAEENGHTGLKWLYDNWDNIKLRNTEEKEKDNVLLKGVKKYITTGKRDEIFTNAVIVYPVAFRDINHLDSGHIAVDEINDSFRNLILYKDAIGNSKDNALIDGNSLRFRLQCELVTLMEETMKLLFYKNGLHNKRLKGKHVEWASRLVISANEFDTEIFGASPINLDTCGMPLSSVAGNYKLFLAREMQSILRGMYDMGMITHKGKVPSKEDFEIDYDKEIMNEWIDTYIESWGERFNKVPVCGSLGKSFVKLSGNYLKGKEEEDFFMKDMTITELIYMASYRVVEDGNKVAMISRYPIQDIYHVFPNKIHVLSTKDRVRCRIGGLEYPYFPDLRTFEDDKAAQEDPDIMARKVSANFEETMKMSNLRLDDIGGDFDGDKCAVRPMFTEEATQECLDNIEKPLHMFNFGGEDTKQIGRESTQAAYSMTLTKDKCKAVEEGIVQAILDADHNELTVPFIFKTCKLGAIGRNGRAKYKMWDTVTLHKGDYKGVDGTVKTTIGRLLFNKVIYAAVDYPYINETFGKKVIKKYFNMIAADVNNEIITMTAFKEMKNRFEDYTMRMSSFICPSTTEEMLVLDKSIKKRREELYNKHRDAIEGGDLTKVGDIQKELKGMVEKRYAGTDDMEIYESGAKPSIGGEYMTSMLSIGVVPTGLGTSDFAVVENNLMDGLGKDEIHKTANTGVIGAYFRGINTAVGGYMNKQAIEVMSGTFAAKVGTDCKTDIVRHITIDPNRTHQYIGRNIMEGKNAVLLTYDNISKYNGKKVKMRTPTGCKTRDICYTCLGDRYHKLLKNDGRIPVGIASTKPFSDLGQKSLKKTHSMGVSMQTVDDFNKFFI